VKRLWAVIAAMTLGLLAAWFFGYVTSRIDWPAPKALMHGCYEIDHCNVAWWVVAIFISWFFGPALVYGVVAFVGIPRQWTFARWTAVYFVLVLITGCLYFFLVCHSLIWMITCTGVQSGRFAGVGRQDLSGTELKR
jgi:hypothetical protein